ncbi:MAG: hypothetical protein M1167_00060 [Chloroflexi bacterium]|nr:hypothetical protein [Chloroflexota bacterium]
MGSKPPHIQKEEERKKIDNIKLQKAILRLSFG